MDWSGLVGKTVESIEDTTGMRKVICFTDKSVVIVESGVDQDDKPLSDNDVQDQSYASVYPANTFA